MSPVTGTMYLSPTPYMGLLNNNGQPLVGGQMFTYLAGTTTKQSAFTDSTGNTPLPNPIILNLRGDVAPSATGTSCGLWFDPTLAYKVVLAFPDDTDPPTNGIWEIDNVVSANAAVLAALAAYEATLGGIQIGTMVAFGGPTAPPGWLFCYGQQVSRTTYSALFAIMGTAYGVGDSSTTFNLPDKRGRVSVGKDNMGGTPANRVTNAVCAIPGTTLGASGGDQNSDPGVLSADSTAVSAVTDPGHKHVIHLVGNGGGPADGDPTSIAGGASPDGQTNDAFTNITVATSVTTTVTSDLTGASQNMQPSEIDNWIIFTGVTPP